MKKYILLIIISLIYSCNNDHSPEDQTKFQELDLDKGEELNKLYTESVLPLFADYENLNIPPELVIDEEDLNINAGAAFNYVEVSRGLVNADHLSIQIFVLAHEVAHIATTNQAIKFGLNGEIPRGTETNEYKKAEYLADLIAVHLIKKELPSQFNQLKSSCSTLKNLLGSEIFTHPSGVDRIASLEVYFQACVIQNDNISFQNRFKSIWKMN